jgi:hypothetical protein
MIEYKTPLDSFIGGWIINKEICEDLIKFFKKNKKRQIDGKVSGVRPNLIDHEIKKSIDLSLHGSDSAFKSYNEQLQICLNKYMDRYPEVFNDYAKFNSTIENYNIQKYDPNEGFYKWHCESR